MNTFCHHKSTFKFKILICKIHNLDTFGISFCLYTLFAILTSNSNQRRKYCIRLLKNYLCVYVWEGRCTCALSCVWRAEDNLLVLVVSAYLPLRQSITCLATGKASLCSGFSCFYLTLLLTHCDYRHVYHVQLYMVAGDQTWVNKLAE